MEYIFRKIFKNIVIFWIFSEKKEEARGDLTPTRFDKGKSIN
jgi:hypothetical protein